MTGSLREETFWVTNENPTRTLMLTNIIRPTSFDMSVHWIHDEMKQRRNTNSGLAEEKLHNSRLALSLCETATKQTHSLTELSTISHGLHHRMKGLLVHVERHVSALSAQRDHVVGEPLTVRMCRSAKFSYREKKWLFVKVLFQSWRQTVNTWYGKVGFCHVIQTKMAAEETCLAAVCDWLTGSES